MQLGDPLDGKGQHSQPSSATNHEISYVEKMP
jgi:hypothetical protein